MVSNLLKHLVTTTGKNNSAKLHRGTFIFMVCTEWWNAVLRRLGVAALFSVNGKASFISNQALVLQKQHKVQTECITFSPNCLIDHFCSFYFYFCLLCSLMASIRSPNRWCWTSELLLAWRNSQVVINKMSWLHLWEHQNTNTLITVTQMPTSQLIHLSQAISLEWWD